jgi:hypothetical protein
MQKKESEDLFKRASEPIHMLFPTFIEQQQLTFKIVKFVAIFAYITISL